MYFVIVEKITILKYNLGYIVVIFATIITWMWRENMGQTSIIETTVEDVFNADDGVVIASTKRAVKKTKLELTDQFVKVSKYLNVIFSYNNIPLRLVPISLLIAQEMEFKTNIIYLLIGKKKEFGEMLNLSLDRVNKYIQECEKYNILRRQGRGVYEVNSFLFSTGSIIETRELQAHFDFENDTFIAKGVQKNLVNGVTVKKAVISRKNKQCEGQLSLFDDDSKKDDKTNIAAKQPKTMKSKNQFNNFQQNTYDFDEIEEKLVENQVKKG